MQTQKLISIAVCLLTANLCYSQNKTIPNIPVMNSKEYSWCSRQSFYIDVDSLAKANSLLMDDDNLAANTEYIKNSKLIVDEILHLISSKKIKAYSYEGNALTIVEVGRILAQNVLVKETGSTKLAYGYKKQNITTIRFIVDIYINKKSLNVETKLLALVPYAVVYDKEGLVMWMHPLFYLYF